MHYYVTRLISNKLVTVFAIKEYTLKFKNKFGQVTVSVKHNIVTASFSGCVDIDLFRIFTAELLNIADQFNAKPWGYLSNSADSCAGLFS